MRQSDDRRPRRGQRFARAFSLLALIFLIVAGLIWLRHDLPPVTPPIPLPPMAQGPLDGKVDHILIEKSARRMTVFRDGDPLKTYRIALGFAPIGDKDREGDGRTPEGRFRIDRRNGASAYHLSLGLDYPQPKDISRARAGGYSPGGDIFIHGQPNSRKGQPTLMQDWTAGCIAVSDSEIQELWAAVEIGTTVEVRP
ncbi:L,D-transpeptidase family protein [Gemmobacter serpentinus]|uniref:L,D-transpeptidase family protein n=1 Tax=Gemmobacter serpentinus TaxID=2652247 RepID=UPI00124DB0D1|nr:L,D-transpeptidase family protein [Gemmobacter serpentinus]